MKGQLTIEFIISSVLFAALIVYAISFVTSVTPALKDAHRYNDANMRAFQISEFLIFDDGSWGDPGDEKERIGLGSDYYRLGSEKMANLESYCNADYDNVLRSLGIFFVTPSQTSDFQNWVLYEKKCVSIKVQGGAATPVDCAPPAGSECEALFETDTPSAEIIRYANSDAGPVKITVRVW